MKLMVYEFFTGGGSSRAPVAGDLYGMGWAMLCACIEDCLKAGHQVHTLIDCRIQRRLPATCIVKPVQQEQAPSVFKETLNEVDGVLLIAPETLGILTTLTSLVEQSGKLLLGSTTEGTRVAGDKFATYATLAKNGFNMPITALWPAGKDEITGPWILKPRGGTGCEGVHLIEQVVDINKIAHLDEYIIQEYIPGTPASVAMIVGKDQTLILSVNLQKIIFDHTLLRYKGGAIPLVHPMSSAAAACAKGIPAAIPGLKGYVGVDLILTENKVYVIEVNPRITFTYCGLRRATPKNLIKIIIDAALGFELEDRIPLTAMVQFDDSGRISLL